MVLLFLITFFNRELSKSLIYRVLFNKVAKKTSAKIAEVFILFLKYGVFFIFNLSS